MTKLAVAKRMYRQCLLRKQSTDGYLEDVRWIPNKLGIKGRTLKVKLDDDTWQDGWVVIEIYNARTIDDLELEAAAERNFARAGGVLGRAAHKDKGKDNDD